MSELFSRLGLRTAILGGALAFLLGACGEPQEQGDQQQGAISPDSGQSSTTLSEDDTAAQSDTEQN